MTIKLTWEVEEGVERTFEVSGKYDDGALDIYDIKADGLPISFYSNKKLLEDKRFLEAVDDAAIKAYPSEQAAFAEWCRDCKEDR